MKRTNQKYLNAKKFTELLDVLHILAYKTVIKSNLTEEIQSITADIDRGSYAKPLLVQALSSHFLNFANAKVAVPGFERGTGDLSSLLS